MVATTSLLCPKNDCQQIVNEFWPCILHSPRAVQWYWPIIKLSAAFLDKHAVDDIVNRPKNQCQSNVNDFRPRILENHGALQPHSSIIRLSAAILGNNACDGIGTMAWKGASTEGEWFLALHLGTWWGCATTSINNWTIGLLFRQKCFWRHRHYGLKLNINGASTILGLASSKIKGLVKHIDP